MARTTRGADRILLAWFGVLAFAACANPWLPKPRQTDAEAVVWRQVYGETVRAPTVGWATPTAACKGTGWMVAQACVAGQFSAADWSARVAWPSGTVSFAATAYAHELLHAHLFRLTGDEDDGHTRPEWGALLTSAGVALVKAGL